MPVLCVPSPAAWKLFPRHDAGDILNFIYAFFPFLFGIYPYTHTQKATEAMKLAHVNHIDYSVDEIVKTFNARLLLVVPLRARGKTKGNWKYDCFIGTVCGNN